MPPKGKSISPLTVRSGIIRELSWLYSQFFDFVISNENTYQQLLAVRCKLLNYEQRYEEISLQLDSDEVSDEEHHAITNKFLTFIANVNVTLKAYELQQHPAASQSPVMERQTVTPPLGPTSPSSVDHSRVINSPPLPSTSVGEVNVNHQPLQPSIPMYQGLQLPLVPLPEFSGSFDSWLEFRDTFSNMVIGNPSLAPATKLYYLRKALSGEALARIQNIPPGNENFDLAWDLLKQRYDNPRLIASTHILGIESPPALKKNCSKSLRAFIDHCKCHINALEALKLKIEIKDLLYMHKITSQLDSNILREWEKHMDINEIPTMEKLWEFLETQCKVMDAVSSHNSSNQPPIQKMSNQVSHSSHSNVSNVKQQHSRPSFQHNNVRNFQTAVSCPFCNEQSHGIFQCPAFSKVPVNQRLDAIKKKRLCFNCLKSFTAGHSCITTNRCKQCDKRHHTILHDSYASISGGKNVVSNSIQSQNMSTSPSVHPTHTSNSISTQPVLESTNSSSTENSVCTSKAMVHSNAASSITHNVKSTVEILPTAEVIVVSSNGELISCTALMDTGSDCCLITQDLAAKLALPPLHVNSLIHGVSGSQSRSTVAHSVLVKSSDHAWSAQQECIVVDQLSSCIPSVTIDLSCYKIPNNIRLADPHFYKSKKIDILLGISVYAAVMTGGQIVVSPDVPIVQNTKLGWIVFGSCQLTKPVTDKLSHHFVSNFVSTIDVSNQLEKFWKLEEVSSVIPSSPESVSVEKHFMENTIRKDDGRFQVSLPRKDSFPALGHSKAQATKRFHSLEKRFSKQPILKSQYVEFMQEYEDLGHMSPVPPPEPDEGVYYIPHHAVFKPDSTTTKTRVVFDASAKTSTGISLNEVLFKGTVVQPDLFEIVLRFRMRPIAFIADITKMYRQILLDPSDRNFHRILWRDDVSQPIKEYTLNTVTYGTACASYLSTRTLNLLAELESTPDSSVYHSIHQDFYVDDLISGSSTLEEALELSHQLLITLNKGCFELRKWMSNSPELLDSLPSHLLETSIVKPISDSEDGITKALGLLWNSISDNLSICSNVNQIAHKTSFTKREFLSVIASTFDPLGIISPVIITPKILFQKLWLAKIGWDDSLPNEILLQWLQIVKQLSDIPKISIPRCVVSKEQCSIIQLHGFSDASATAYGACVYVRIISNNTVQTRLLCAKSRVAPLKPISIPNLELCGALVLSRLINKVVDAFKSLRLTISNVFLWSDSQIVCNWIQSLPDRKSIFVSLRVGEIQETTSHYSWNHVKTSHNPADLISRGASPNELSDNNLWWHGPSWLSDPTDSWNSFSSHIAVLVPNTVLVNAVIVSPLSNIFERVSSSLKMIRITAYVLRFLHNIRQRSSNRRIGSLSVDEIQNAEIHLLKIVQAEVFNKELEILRSNEELNALSSFHSLSLFIHSDGLIRVGGRLANADVSFDYKHQILLPRKHKFTKALIIAHHNKLCHAGVQATMSTLRQRFWIPSTRRTVKDVLRKCIKCFRFTQFRSTQLMGQLPAVRVNVDFPFINVGLDYAGPFSLRLGGPKSRTFSKAYFALFICMTTRAVHIEVVSELSTSAFLAALTRFISKRGIPRNIYSDNATTFVGANNELKELSTFLSLPHNQQVFQNSAASWHIQWNFIPPRAPHHGGLWERAIKHFKGIFKVVTFKRIWNFEEMYTLSAQIEAILNSRPIVPLSEDPHDLAFLSPGHFIIGRPLNALPSREQKVKHINFLARWHRLAEVTKQFWEQWSQEYLVTLQKRHKWSSSSPNLQVGTLVLLKDTGTSPTFWKLGRITEVFPGSDDKVRVIHVLTDAGVFKRSIASVAPLPFDDVE